MRHEDAKLNAPVFVDHLDEERPDISLESHNSERLRERQVRVTGTLRTWVAGQVNRSIWVQMTSNGRLVPYNLSELNLVTDCVCAAMANKQDIEYTQGWDCPSHGFVRAGTAQTEACHQQEMEGRIRQVSTQVPARAREDHHFAGTGERCGECSLSFDQGAHFIQVKQPA